MLTEIGSVDNVPDFIKSVKAGKAKLQGFGHRVYKNYDPRAKIIKEAADQVFAVTGKNPLLDIALKLEEAALSDDYFISRKLYPNVDFYSGLIYQAMNFPVEMFTVLFAIPRVCGWLAHYQELLDQDQKIYRPRQLWIGADERPYVPMESPKVGRSTVIWPDFGSITLGLPARGKASAPATLGTRATATLTGLVVDTLIVTET
jgi:citrate synthase